VQTIDEIPLHRTPARNQPALTHPLKASTRVRKAVNQLAKRDPKSAERIPEYRRLIAFRNALSHGYAEVG
jgi:hypothetical protein